MNAYFLDSEEENGSLSDQLLPPTEQDTERTRKDTELPLPLRLLYGLNGVILSLPITALLYIVNTRASVPVEYLSAFGAISFLPCSLKPLYACMSQYCQQTALLIVVLLVTCGIFTAATAFIPSGGVVLCFVLAFCRGITSSWPEFLLGLCLIHHAQESPQSYSLAAARLQSQAATCRNIGSFVATTIALILFIYERRLNDRSVTILLVSTGGLNLLAAAIAWWFRVGDKLGKFPDRQCLNGNSVALDDECSVPTSPCASLCTNNGLILVVFQLCIIIFAMQGPIVDMTSESTWSFSLLSLIVALTCLLLGNNNQIGKWRHTHRVGLFLILRHAIPDSSYIMASFVYDKLQSTPILLQGLSIFTMGVTTLSSWSFGKLLAKYNHGMSLLLLMAATTIAASLLSLGNLLVVSKADNYDYDEGRQPTAFYLVLLLVSGVTTFAGEWAFLPDVVIATTAVGDQEQEYIEYDGETSILQVESISAPLVTEERDCQQDEPARNCCRKNGSTTGIEYGTLISCIDFGDQIGAWVTVPLVSAFGISRENEWNGLGGMIVLTAVIRVCSVFFLCIVRNERESN